MTFWVDMDHRVLIVLLSLWSPVMPNDIRLVGGASRCAGTLEKAEEEKWEPVLVKVSDLAAAAEACGQLDCGSVVSARGIQITRPLPFSNFFSDFTDIYKLEITCSDSIRLVNGTNLCSGRLEVKSNKLWSPVCKKGFDRRDAEMVCRDLGCGSPLAFQEVLHGGFQCEGTAVGLTCLDPDEVRLVGGANRCAGILELKHNGEWRAVISQRDPWGLKMSTKICRWLDCGSAVSTQQTEGGSEKHVHHLSAGCFRSKYSLRECVLIKDTKTNSRLEITCSVPLTRLVNGTELCSGRLEVKPNQSWSSVCGDGFDQQDAEVVCRELGCGAPSVFHVGLHGEKAPAWMEEFQCDGNESALLDCRRSASAAKTCPAVGLACSDLLDVRLVGEAHRCAGELEVKNQGEWRPAVDWISQWNQESAAAVCRQLGCGSAVSTKGTETLDRPVWWIDSACVRSTSALTDCVMLTGSLEFYSGHQVICSDLLAQPNISLSPSTDGHSEAEQCLVQVLMGSDFTITCSTEPQYQGGTFQLVFTASNRARNHTLPAVNHSAHFLLSAADYTHQGDYRCVYHVHLFSHNFSSGSRPLSVAVSAPLTELMIRFAVLLLSMTLLITALCLTSKVSSRRPSTAQGKNAEPSGSGLGRFSNDYENKLESRGDGEISQPQPLLEEVKQA